MAEIWRHKGTKQYDNTDSTNNFKNKTGHINNMKKLLTI